MARCWAPVRRGSRLSWPCTWPWCSYYCKLGQLSCIQFETFWFLFALGIRRGPQRQVQTGNQTRLRKTTHRGCGGRVIGIWFQGYHEEIACEHRGIFALQLKLKNALPKCPVSLGALESSIHQWPQPRHWWPLCLDRFVTESGFNKNT